MKTPSDPSKEQKSKLSGPRQDYPEEFLYPDENQRKAWDKPDDLGGIYSESLIGGPDKSRLNRWQGPQDLVKSEQP